WSVPTVSTPGAYSILLIDAFEQAAALPEAAGLAEPPPELLPQAATLRPMAAAVATIMMRRMETVLAAGEHENAPLIVGAPAYRFRRNYPSSGPGSWPANRR